jgi:hypothetical protein
VSRVLEYRCVGQMLIENTVSRSDDGKAEF